MKKQIVQVSVVQSAKVMAAVYLVTSVPIVALAALFMSTQLPGGLRVVVLVVMPVLYALAGFIGAVIGALIYNLVAARIGGIEFTTAEVGAACTDAGPARDTAGAARPGFYLRPQTGNTSFCCLNGKYLTARIRQA